MKISIRSLLEGARSATGAVAVIDTFRAFTTGAVALANGASRIIMVETVEEAMVLREATAGAVCMGEVGGEGCHGHAFGAGFGGGGFRLIGRAVIMQCDIPAGFGQIQHNGAPQPFGGAGYQCGFALRQ